MSTESRAKKSLSSRSVTRIPLDSHHEWGRVELPNLADVHRRGWGRYRLTVFPPGTNDSERRTLALSQSWSGWGFAVALIGAVALADLRSFAPLLMLGVVYAAGLLITRTLARRLRGELRVVSAIVTCLAGETRLVGQPELFRRSLERLEQLDAEYRAGRLTPVQFEAGWSAVYGALDDRASRGSRAWGTLSL
ncbi:hypothetical protein F1C58_10780 [Glaciihabitans sp. INWT7]|uniref:DUF6611 family protein n=1 Tax=Glaciihabitans sp. INWT7 TaxID=2596912 RepID=UPI001623FB42|nr:DUF6611 family protein [Glaciihabitans sp. INWT7]QNE47333.1 hypothetical protein F1C58_10780 [Glaciihabitans sp. INWT7]